MKKFISLENKNGVTSKTIQVKKRVERKKQGYFNYIHVHIETLVGYTGAYCVEGLTPTGHPA